MKKFRVLIPAGGRSSRSGLNYPKTLHKIGGLPILIRICRLVAAYDIKPLIIINPAFQQTFKDVLETYNQSADLIYQHEPRGMGDAVLKAESVLDDETTVILIWSDIPLLNELTLQHLTDCHKACENDFSMVTYVGRDCYTIVERTAGKLTAVIETRAAGIAPAAQGERDIGLFVFEKAPVYKLLKEAAIDFTSGIEKEQSFLTVVAQLNKAGNKIEGYPIAMATDVLSFNTPEELATIERVAGQI
jgi:bifunctional UDP-N-acetylglucosamine pyrophosphorylase/glucosamine-1-phosphate N-acetyltransferase